MNESPRLNLPFLEAAQIEKSVTHNEALALLDIAVCAAVDGYLLNSPPASPAIGSCYVVGSAPSGAWAGQANALAGYSPGGWRFLAALEGLTAIEKSSGEMLSYRSGAWEKGHVHAAKLSVGGNQVVGSRQAAVADPASGTVVDAEARAAIAAILARLRAHGLIAG